MDSSHLVRSSVFLLFKKSVPDVVNMSSDMIFLSVLGAQKDGLITQTRSLNDPGPSCNSKNFVIYSSFPLSRYF